MCSWNIISEGIYKSSEKYLRTRMHSSRMRTGRSLTVRCSVLPGGGFSLVRGGFSLVRGGGFSLVQGGVLLGPGGVLWRTPPLLTESQTRVKT